VAQDLDSLGALLKTEQHNLNSKTKLLENLRKNPLLSASGSGNMPNMMFFEGQEGLKKIYLSMLREAPKNSVMRIVRDEFIWRKEWQFVFDAEWHDIVKYFRKSKNIHTKLLVNNSATEKKHSKLYSSRQALDIKFLPARSQVKNFAFYILGDTTSILSMDGEAMHGAKLTDSSMAKNTTTIFKELWSNAS
jgi:hypothetical protein